MQPKLCNMEIFKRLQIISSLLIFSKTISKQNLKTWFFLLLNSPHSFIIREVKLINLVLLYVNSLSKTTNFSATFDYLILFQCKKKSRFLWNSTVHHRIQEIKSMFLSWPKYIHSSYSCSFSLRYTLILSCHFDVFSTVHRSIELFH